MFKLLFYQNKIPLTNLVFSVRTLSYGPSFSRGFVACSTDRENEASKIIIISLRLIGREGKETS